MIIMLENLHIHLAYFFLLRHLPLFNAFFVVTTLVPSIENCVASIVPKQNYCISGRISSFAECALYFEFGFEGASTRTKRFLPL
jgi:hypothetical protein